MAKQIKNTNNIRSSELIPKKYQSYLMIALIIILVYSYFMPAINAGGFGGSDSIASYSFKTYKAKMAEQGEFPLWVPYIFGGMPAYESLLMTGDRSWDFIAGIIFGFAGSVGDIFGNDVARLALYYVIYGIGIFLLFSHRKKDKLIAGFVAISAILSTSVITWVAIGHATKPVVLSTLPWIILSFEKLKEKMNFTWVAVMIIFLHIMFEGAHMQMIFYCGLTVFIYGLVQFISGIKNGDQKNSIRAVVILIISTGLAFGMSADRYMSTFGFTEHSTRGSAPTLSTQSDLEKSQESGGNTYDYATQYSFSVGEMITFLVPNYYGFGRLKYDNDDPNKILNRMTNNGENELYTYYGQKEIEDAPPYMGIVVFAFALLGLIYYRKDKIVLSLLISSIIFLLISFGKNLPALFDLFFYNMSAFNKFRAPSMALAMLQFAFPIFAGFGIYSVFDLARSSEGKKKLMLVVYSFAGFFILALLFKIGLEDFYKSGVNVERFIAINLGGGAQVPANILQDVKSEYLDFMFDSASSDFLVNGILLLFCAAGIWLYVKEKISTQMLVILLLVLSLFDLWRVDKRKFDYNKEKIEQTAFPQIDYVDFIKQDKDHFRVADFVLSGNMPAYYLLENVNGYHSAKLRIIQDVLDATSGGNTTYLQDPFMWSLFNVKYVIQRQESPDYPVVFQSKQTGAVVMRNPNYFPRAYFALGVEQKSNEDILKKFRDRDYYNPSVVTYMERVPEVNIEAPDSTATIAISNKTEHLLELDVNASGNNLVNVSEIYYKPGWKAYIDGEETQIYRSNFAFRSVVVPKGKHSVRFEYDLPAFETGKTASLAINILTILLLAAGLVLNFKKKN